MAFSAETPMGAGLTQLAGLSQVFVRQRATNSARNKYDIFDGDNRFMHARSSQLYYRMKAIADFDIDVCDTQDTKLFHLRRKVSCFSDKMQVVVDGRLVCVVRNKSTLCTARMLVHDLQDKPVLRIKSSSNGMCEDADFNIFGMDTAQIGVITRRWEGLRREFLTNKDLFLVRFPPDLDVGYKCALIGACFLIDFLCYEP